MELQIINKPEPFQFPTVVKAGNNTQSTGRPFIEANTIECSLLEIKNDHIIPVFIKDNEPLINHADFVDAAMEVVEDYYSNETILSPNIRVSHPIKGRIPEAKNKPANELYEHEKTLYYERMAFIIEIPSVYDDIDGNRLSLTIGGVKSFNQDNLFSKKGSDEHFKIFIGFKNTVCTNLCVWSDGIVSDLKIGNVGMLKGALTNLITKYEVGYHLKNMRTLSEYSLTEKQFAEIVGKLRMYPHLPRKVQNEINPLQLGDTQMTTVVKDYYNDHSFCRGNDGEINLWRLYNLLTGANKSSYIDNFLERGVNAFHFTENIKYALQKKMNDWYLS